MYSLIVSYVFDIYYYNTLYFIKVMNNTDIIRKIYLNPSTGFKSIVKTYQTIKEEYPQSNITRKDVENFIKNQSVHQIHTNEKVDKTQFNPIIAKKIGFLQMDIADLNNYKNYNKGFRYLLVMVDIVSRYSFMEPLKTKSAEEVYR